jgi:WhiB family transcriptional regulator, redox-sensing transcriptional regulator
LHQTEEGVVALMWNRSVEWDAEDWRKLAACRHTEPDLFFPVGTTGPALRQVDEAKRICRACPARTPCLAWALGNAIPAGIWGGTTEAERRAIRSTRTGRVATQPRQRQLIRGHRDRGALGNLDTVMLRSPAT